MPPLITPFPYCTGSPSWCNEAEGNEKFTDWEGRNKTVNFLRWHDNVKKFQRINKKLLEWVYNYSKFARYKVSIRKSTGFPYPSNTQLGFEIKNTTSFTLTP